MRWLQEGDIIQIRETDRTVILERAQIIDAGSYMGQYIPFTVKDLDSDTIHASMLFQTDRASIKQICWGDYLNMREVTVRVLQQ